MKKTYQIFLVILVAVLPYVIYVEIDNYFNGSLQQHSQSDISKWRGTAEGMEVTDQGLKLSRSQEKNAMRELSCKELKEKYDGKIHTIQWEKNKEYVIVLFHRCDRTTLNN